ncbi:MAG: LacI family DNA-binding transcriptional regulator [Chloroflexota bacterium]
MSDNDVTTLSRGVGGAAPPPRPTLRDVAALAGVGFKTVSRVVNGEPGVSPETQRRVERAIAQLDYRPNLTASNLRRTGGKTATVGLMLEDVANPFSSTVHRALCDAAALRGVAVLGASLDEDATREQATAEAFVRRRVDGLVIAPTAPDQSYLLKDVKAGLAVVFIDRPPSFLDADLVVATNAAGSREAVALLLGCGHRRIAFLGDLRSIWTARERAAGYEAALADAGVPVDPALVRQDLRTREEADRATAELLALPEPPTAIFAGQNLITIGVIRALRRAGAERRIALVGFDDVELADLLSPGLTVVAQDPVAIGQAAAELLFTRLDGDRGPGRRVEVPTRLVMRGSGEIPPAA